MRLVPIVIASLSLTIEVLYGLLSAFRSTPSEGDHEEAENIVRRTPLQGIKRHIQYYGGYTIYGFMFGRLVGTLLLLYLSIPNTLRCQPPMGWSSGTSTTECPDYFLSLTFVSHPVISFGRYTRLATFQQLYTSVLSVIALISRTWSSAATRSNIVTLLSAFFVYAYRDLWPLATYTQNPADEAEGSVLWAKIAILAVIAVVIPLFIPRRYVPVDSKVILVPHIFVKAASDDLGVVEPDACAQC